MKNLSIHMLLMAKTRLYPIQPLKYVVTLHPLLDPGLDTGLLLYMTKWLLPQPEWYFCWKYSEDVIKKTNLPEHAGIWMIYELVENARKCMIFTNHIDIYLNGIVLYSFFSRLHGMWIGMMSIYCVLLFILYFYYVAKTRGLTFLFHSY